MNNFIFEETAYSPVEEKAKAAIFTVGNGRYGCRGFHEESTDDLTKLGGIYQAGLFGLGVHESYDGSKIAELLNTPNVLRVKIVIDNEEIELSKIKHEAFFQRLNFSKGIYQRGYTVILSTGKKVDIQFERMAHLEFNHLLAQKITFRSDCEVSIQLETMMDASISNLNLESTEPLPVQPGRKHLELIDSDVNFFHLQSDYDQIKFAQKGKEKLNLQESEYSHEYESNGMILTNKYSFNLLSKREVTYEKIVATTNNQEEVGYLTSLEQYLNEAIDYKYLAERQEKAWGKVWQKCDVALVGNNDMQKAIRYNLFHLYSSAPRHTNKLSIGARGLSGEMYEGCVFWDLEIFKLPFFIYQFPEEAKKLLYFRYHTLEEAKKHANNNLFDGSFFPWQVSSKGKEQTQKNVGAFYAIHIVADIAYAISKYMEATDDQDALVDFLAELLIETCRFWVSRVSISNNNKGYEILAVRGPNEYDVIVNNNCYTNTMAAENLKITVRLLKNLSKK